MNYGIWLSWNNQQEGFQIPVNPGSIEISDGGKSTSYDVIGIGEINVIKSPALTEYQFSSFFPSLTARQAHSSDNRVIKVVDPFVQAELQLAPREYVNYLIKWMASKRPIRFIFTGASFDINVAATIESFEWKEIAGSSGDIEYSLKLKKYVFYAAKRVLTEKAKNSVKNSAKSRLNDKQTPKTYTLRGEDTLWKVAKTQLGNGDRWREIQKLNGFTDAQLKTLTVGKVIRLPPGGEVYV